MFNWLKTRFKAYFAGQNQPVWNTFNGAMFGTYDAYGSQREPQILDLLRAGEDIAYACTTLVSSSCAALAPKLYYKETEVTDHPILDILADPNPHHSWHDILEFIQLYQELTGIAYLHYEEAAQRLWIMPPQNVELISRNQIDVDEYRLRIGMQGVQTLNPATVYSFKFPNPFDPFLRGYSPTRAAYEKLNLENKYESFLAASLDNQGNPSGFLRPKEAIHPDTASRMAKEYAQIFANRRSGGIAILPDNFEFQALSFPPKDIVGSIEQVRLIRTAVCNCFGIPPGIFDVVQGNRASLETSLTQLAQEALQPRIRRRDEQLTRWAKTFNEELYFCTEDIVPEDKDFQLRERQQCLAELQAAATIELQKRQAKLQEITLLVNTGSITKNEARTSLGFQPKEGFDGTSAPPAPSFLAFHPPQGLPALNPPEKKHLKKKVKLRDLVKVLQAYFAKQRAEVLRNLKDIEKKLADLPEDRTFPGLSRKAERWEQVQSKAVETVLDIKAWTDLLYEDCWPILRLVATASINNTLRKIGVSTEDFSVIGKNVIETVQNLVLQFCHETNQTTGLYIEDAYNEVKRQLKEGILQGDSYVALTDRVSEVYSDAATWRSYRIAQTENARIKVSASIQAAEESGAVAGKKFLVSNNACPECTKIAEREGNEVKPLDYKYVDNAYTKGQPPIHPHCRCDFTFELDPSYTKED